MSRTDRSATQVPGSVRLRAESGVFDDRASLAKSTETKKVGNRKRIEEKMKGKEERKKEKRVANDASSIIIITICDGFSRIRRRAKALSSNK